MFLARKALIFGWKGKKKEIGQETVLSACAHEHHCLLRYSK